MWSMALSAIIGGEVIGGLAHPGENLGCVLEQIWLPLIGVAAHEAVEILEAHPRRPLIERPGTAVLESGGVMVLAEPGRGKAVLLQNFADRGVVYANDEIVTGITGCLLGNDSEARRMMVAPGDQRRPRRRAERCRMKLRVAQARFRNAVQGRRRDDAAKCAGNTVAGVIGHDEQDIRCALGRHNLWRPIRFGVLGVEANLPAETRSAGSEDIFRRSSSLRWASQVRL